jgi:hypothetical protein
MRAYEFITDAINHGVFPEPKNLEYLIKLAEESDTTIQVQPELFILNNKEWYFLKNKNDIQGAVKLSKLVAAGKEYNHVDVIYVFPEFRKTKAIYNLIYYTKEIVNAPTLVDGAIFKDGQQLLSRLAKSNLARVSILDKTTGEKTPFDTTINDLDKCYILESTTLGFGKQIFPGTENYTWFQLFEEMI